MWMIFLELFFEMLYNKLDDRWRDAKNKDALFK